MLLDHMCYLESPKGDSDNLHSCNPARVTPRQRRHAAIFMSLAAYPRRPLRQPEAFISCRC